MSAAEGTLEADDLNDFRFEQLLTRISAESLIQEAPIFQFPDSILVNIFSFLEHEDILTSVRLVCRKWLVVGRDRYIWNRCDFYDYCIDPDIAIEKFVACCRYAQGVQQLTFSNMFWDSSFRQREHLLLVHMPDLQRCVSPILDEQSNLKSFCDALGRYCPLLTSLHVEIGHILVYDKLKLKLTNHSSCFNMLKRCEHLTALAITSALSNLGGCVTPSFVAVLEDCIPNLEELFLDSTNVFEPGLVEALKNSSLQLKKLHFGLRRILTDRTEIFSKKKSLKHLSGPISFVGSGFDDPGPPKLITNLLKTTTEDGGLCDLTELYLRGKVFGDDDYNIYDDSFYSLVTKLNMLTVMTLDSIHITDVSLHTIAVHCTKLEMISLISCQRVTNNGILCFIRKLKVLKKVKLCLTGDTREGDFVKIMQTAASLHIDVEAIDLDTLMLFG